jgi:DNA adenine methylase
MGYLGSKAASGAFQAIIALMPPHDTYIELFAGSGAILLRKPSAARSIAVDLDPQCLSLIRTTRPDVECVNQEAGSFLDGFNYAGSGRILIYADPPYLHSTRTSTKRYRYEMTDAHHRALLVRLRSWAPASIIVSGYPSRLYDDLLSDWHTVEFQAMTRGGPRTEKLWLNFAPHGSVQWSSFAGANFTDRQRIKRKALRWAENYRALPAGERLAVLAALLEVDAQNGHAGTIDASDYGRRRRT